MDKKIIFQMKKKGRSYQYIANCFGVSRQRIWQIINGNSENEKKRKEVGKEKYFGGLRKKRLQYDDDRCQICWMTNDENKKLFNRNLSVHHLDGDKKNNIFKNLMTLCNQCHAEIHLNKIIN